VRPSRLLFISLLATVNLTSRHQVPIRIFIDPSTFPF
jgi:hypothetical protein